MSVRLCRHTIVCQNCNTADDRTSWQQRPFFDNIGEKYGLGWRGERRRRVRRRPTVAAYSLKERQIIKRPSANPTASSHPSIDPRGLGFFLSPQNAKSDIKRMFGFWNNFDLQPRPSNRHLTACEMAGSTFPTFSELNSGCKQFPVKSASFQSI